MKLLVISFPSSLRRLVRHPRFAIVAAALLAVGIGFAAALASLSDALLFRPLPVPNPHEMLRVYSTSKLHSMGYVSYPDYQDFSRLATTASGTVSGVVAQTQVLAAVRESPGQSPRMRLGLAVSANYFDVLQIAAQRGRTFHIGDDAQSPVLILSDAFWRAHFRANPSLIGNIIEVRNAPYTVIGIAPAGFGMDRFLHEDFYVPIEAYGARLSEGNPLQDRARRFLAVYARAKNKSEAVQQELAALAQSLEQSFPDSNRGQHALVLTEADARRKENGSLPAVAVLLLALAALVLLAACTSVAGWMILRALQRAPEISLRRALGATSAHLRAETFLDTSVYALAGFAAGLLLARATLAILASVFTLPGDIPMGILGNGAACLDPRVISLAALAALASVFVCGLAPHFRSSKPPRNSGRVTRSGRAGRFLLATQLALALVLIGLAIQFLTNMRSLRQIPLGYQTDHILVMSFDPAQAGLTEVRARQFYRDLLERVKNLPAVRGATLAQSIPLGPAAAQKQIRVLGTAGTGPLSVWSNIVAPGYFSLMQIPLLDGRSFTEADSATAPAVVIVNETLARHWPGGRAIGKTIVAGGRALHIVGVAPVTKYLQINEPARPFIYLPFSQNYVSHLTLHIKTTGPTSAAAPSLLAAIRELDPTQPVTGIRPLDEYFTEGALFGVRLGAALAALAACVALLLALAGLSAMVSEAFRKRHREIGIRLALGAPPSSIVGIGLAYSAKIAALGCLIGTPILYILARALDQIIPIQTPPVHPVSNALSALAAALLVSCSGMAASSIPVAKTARIDPAIALREQD